jgi:hypothetical protein
MLRPIGFNLFAVCVGFPLVHVTEYRDFNIAGSGRYGHVAFILSHDFLQILPDIVRIMNIPL